jgi:hypothetical protein
MAFPDPQVMVATGVGGGKNIAVASLHGPKSYTIGGVTVGARQFGLDKVDFVQPMDASTDGLNYTIINSTPVGGGAVTTTVRWFVVATNAEVGNGVDLSAKRIMTFAVGV